MKAKTSFVGTDCRVEFNPVPAIDLYIPLIVIPRHPEHDDTLRLNHASQDFFLSILGMISNEWNDSFGNFLHRLDELRFMRILSGDFIHEVLHLLVNRMGHQRVY